MFITGGRPRLKLELAAQSGIELLALYPASNWRVAFEERFPDLSPSFVFARLDRLGLYEYHMSTRYRYLTIGSKTNN